MLLHTRARLVLLRTLRGFVVRFRDLQVATYYRKACMTQDLFVKFPLSSKKVLFRDHLLAVADVFNVRSCCWGRDNFWGRQATLVDPFWRCPLGLVVQVWTLGGPRNQTHRRLHTRVLLVCSPIASAGYHALAFLWVLQSHAYSTDMCCFEVLQWCRVS